MDNCRVCRRPLFSDPLLVYPGMPDRAQYLPDTNAVGSVTLYVCQCSGCGLIQLDNDPVPYWRENITNASLSEDMKKVREKRLREFRQMVDKSAPDFTSYNRLEHIPDPNTYLSQFYGCGIVEVPNFDMMRKEGLFYEFVRDHLMYFTKGTLSFALKINGFHVFDISEIHGDYILSAIVKRRIPDLLLYRSMSMNVMAQSFTEIFRKHKLIAVYGASHQALTIIPMLGIKDRIWYIVDDTLSKQGKFAPSTRIPISPPRRLSADPVDAIIVMCGSYSREVASRLDHPSVYILTPSGVVPREAN